MTTTKMDMSGPFSVVAWVFLGGGLVASVGTGSLLPVLVVLGSLAVLLKVFRGWEK